MLPVVRGERETTRSIVVYSFVLVGVTLLPVARADARRRLPRLRRRPRARLHRASPSRSSARRRRRAPGGSSATRSRTSRSSSSPWRSTRCSVELSGSRAEPQEHDASGSCSCSGSRSSSLAGSVAVAVDLRRSCLTRTGRSSRFPRSAPDGIALAVKDLIDTAGLVTTYGSAIFRDHVPERSASCGDAARGGRLRRRRARRTCTSSPTASPRTTRTSARSSTRSTPAASRAGRAAGTAPPWPPVSARSRSGPTAPARSGSRQPAAGSSASSRHGGSCPTDGVFPLAPSFDTVGPMARSVARPARPCCARSGSGLPGHRAREPARRRSPGRSTPTRSSAPASRRPQRCCPDVEHVDFPLPGDLNPAFQVEAAESSRALHRELFAQHRGLYGENVRRKLEAAFAVSEEAVATPSQAERECLPRAGARGARRLRRPPDTDDADGRPAGRDRRPRSPRADDPAHAAVQRDGLAGARPSLRKSRGRACPPRSRSRHVPARTRSCSPSADTRGGPSRVARRPCPRARPSPRPAPARPGASRPRPARARAISRFSSPRHDAARRAAGCSGTGARSVIRGCSGAQPRHRDVDERAGIGELLLVAGEERGRVPVGADAEQDEVERAPGARASSERSGWICSSGIGDAREERLAGQALVRVGVVGRHEALVAPPDVPRRPVELQLRKPLVDGARRRAARQRDPERRSALRASPRSTPRRAPLGRVRREAPYGLLVDPVAPEDLELVGEKVARRASARPGPVRASRPSTSTSSISPAGSSWSSTSRPSRESRASRGAGAPRSSGPATRIVRRLRHVRPELGDARPPGLASAPRRCRRRRCGRTAAGSRRSRARRPATRASRRRGGRRHRRAARSSAAPNGSGPRQRRKTGRSETSSGITTLAGAAARVPHSRIEMTSEQTSRSLAPADEAAEVDLALEHVVRLVGPREEQDGARRVALGQAGERAPWPASTQRSGTQAMCVITLARMRGAAPGSVDASRSSSELALDLADAAQRTATLSAAARSGRRGGGARRRRVGPQVPAA